MKGSGEKYLEFHEYMFFTGQFNVFPVCPSVGWIIQMQGKLIHLPPSYGSGHRERERDRKTEGGGEINGRDV